MILMRLVLLMRLSLLPKPVPSQYIQRANGCACSCLQQLCWIESLRGPFGHILCPQVCSEVAPSVSLLIFQLWDTLIPMIHSCGLRAPYHVLQGYPKLSNRSWIYYILTLSIPAAQHVGAHEGSHLLQDDQWSSCKAL